MSLLEKAEAHARADTATPDLDGKLDKVLAGITSLSTRVDAVEESSKADAEGGKKLDMILTHLDSMGKKVDACVSRMDSIEAKEKAKCDAEEEEKKKSDAAKADAEKEDEKKKADKARADAEEEDRKKVDAARGSGAALLARLEAVEKATTVLPDTDLAKFTAAQVQADRVYHAFGDSAPRWMAGEALPSYQRRLLVKVQKHSKAWKDKELSQLHDSVLDVAETQIYADALSVAMSPSSVTAGTLREVVETDRAGRRISKFFGDPEACWGPFKGRVVKGVDRINLRPGT
jgi:colicin import membrane protein